MDNISSPLRETVGPTEHQIELFPLVNSTTAEGECSNSQSSRIDVPDIEPINETNICKIFKVPAGRYIHEDNEHSFKPKILSIGPYNYGSSHLRRKKLTCREGILGSISKNYYDTDQVQELQRKARSFYCENITMEPKRFAEMLLLDGCFILAALIDMENLNLPEIFNWDVIFHDLLLVENQIPFFVLEEIHKIAAGEGETTESLKRKIATLVERVLQKYPKAIGSSEIYRNDFHHLVHLCHMFFRPTPNSVKHHHDQAVKNQWHRAMQYHEAGVKFRVKDSSTPYSLLDVTFSNGTMEIPHLSIDANTESIFSSLILFEKSGCPHAGTYINAYITFMSKLLNDIEDVELLVQESIIEIVGRHEEILKLFSRLNRLAVNPHHMKDYYLESTLQSVEAHYRWRSNWWMAWLKRYILCEQICKIELFSLDNSTTAEGERGNSESFRIDVPDTERRNETNKCKIFKVPGQIINDGNMIAFKPKTVSIGPYNYESSHLSGMEWKKACQAGILGDWKSENYYYRDEIKALQSQAREFYSDNISMGPESFDEMVLLDGCFILAALIGMRHKHDDKHDKDKKNKKYLNLQEVLNMNDILHDLLLVENQIPFFVLEKIHMIAEGEGETSESLKRNIAEGEGETSESLKRNIAEGEGETTESLKEEIVSRVEGLLRKYPKAIKSSEICRNDFHHLVHLCHMFFRPSLNSDEQHHDQAVINQWHRAMQYHEAGVKFRVKDSSTGCSLLDVTFSKGTMEIPHLFIDANTESIFSNLILFEQENHHAGKYINAYITFMSKLLSDKEDVKLLVRERIIEIVGRPKEILNLFSRLSRLAVYPHHGEDYYLESTLQSVEAHYRWRPNWWMAWLKQNRLINPFVALATLAGIIVLLCTITQTVFDVLQFYKPAK